MCRHSRLATFAAPSRASRLAVNWGVHRAACSRLLLPRSGSGARASRTVGCQFTHASTASGDAHLRRRPSAVFLHSFQPELSRGAWPQTQPPLKHHCLLDGWRSCQEGTPGSGRRVNQYSGAPVHICVSLFFRHSTMPGYTLLCNLLLYVFYYVGYVVCNRPILALGVRVEAVWWVRSYIPITWCHIGSVCRCCCCGLLSGCRETPVKLFARSARRSRVWLSCGRRQRSVTMNQAGNSCIRLCLHPVAGWLQPRTERTQFSREWRDVLRGSPLQEGHLRTGDQFTSTGY